ncbi:hypothetical protein Pmani_015329 [Petrolisthes manimaculis]|uniref:Uncharacterized protein n=1 Tax=Petrolisthes manimaculis TaxID=1843537 RepID=A0AAE1PR45_9EUCA|nr:hypothetical protein Pmani_015329 [Petrolisthes manimaculis]
MSHYTGDREGQQCYEECSEEDDHHNQYQYQDQNDEKTSPTLRDQLLSLVQKDAVSEVVSVVCGDGDDEGEVITTTTTTTWDPLLLWVRPQPCCLHAIAGHVRKAGLSALASVGCGTGLLEWLLQALTDAVSEVVSVVCGDGDDEGEVITTTTTTTWDPLLLWVRPQPCCLHAIAGHVRKAGLSALASVGCGTGLLEWLLQALTGVNVIGYEVNEEWWKSKYAPPTFIPLTFTKGTDSPPPLVPPTHALMCCYFNHAHTFQ